MLGISSPDSIEPVYFGIHELGDQKKISGISSFQWMATACPPQNELCDMLSRSGGRDQGIGLHFLHGLPHVGAMLTHNAGVHLLAPVKFVLFCFSLKVSQVFAIGKCLLQSECSKENKRSNRLHLRDFLHIGLKQPA